MSYALSGKRVFVAGHRGMVGAALVRRLAGEGCEIVTAPRDALDLADQAAVRRWFADRRPHAVLLAAARVGGILANDRRPADFLLDNLQIATNVLEAAHRADVEKLLFLGSSCIYPRDATQPINEDALLSGPLEPTNQWYAVAKIAGIKLAQAFRRQHGRDFIAALPCNLYGPGDNFDPDTSHVLPALVRKACEARRGGGPLVVWGTGAPRRELLHVDDLADACLLLLRAYSGEAPVNVGAGADIAILDLARLVAEVAGHHGPIVTDPSKPDGTPRKLLDDRVLRGLGWRPRIGLREGVERLHAEFLAQAAA